MATDINKPFYFSGKNITDFIYEDEQCVVFEEDIDKQAPIHFLVVPRKPIPRLSEASVEDEKLLGHLLITARLVANNQGLNESGYRVVLNDGKHAMEKYKHIHVQVFGGRQMGWPFGHLLLVAKNIAIQKNLHYTGYHVMVDESYSLNKFNSLHVFGRALHHMLWPVGPGSRL